MKEKKKKSHLKDVANKKENEIISNVKTWKCE